MNKNDILIPTIEKGEETLLGKYDNDWTEYIKQYARVIDPCKNLKGEAKILVISDLHGNTSKKVITDFIMHSIAKVDLCIVLGDLDNKDMVWIKGVLPRKKTVTILGNHDHYGQYTDCGFRNLNRSEFHVNEISFVGMQGGIKYKSPKASERRPVYTHIESIYLSQKIPIGDVLITHDAPYIPISSENCAHKGMIGITKYIYDNQIPLNIHGHQHKNKIDMLSNGCCSIGVHIASIIELNNNKITITHWNAPDKSCSLSL